MNQKIGGDIQKSKDLLKIMYDKRMQDLTNRDLDVNESSPLYTLMDSFFVEATKGEGNIEITNDQDKEMYKKLASVRLYIAQQEREIKRGANIAKVYDNKGEMKAISAMIEDYQEQHKDDTTKSEMQTQIEKVALEVYDEISEVFIEGQQHEKLEPTNSFMGDLQTGVKDIPDYIEVDQRDGKEIDEIE